MSAQTDAKWPTEAEDVKFSADAAVTAVLGDTLCV